MKLPQALIHSHRMNDLVLRFMKGGCMEADNFKSRDSLVQALHERHSHARVMLADDSETNQKVTELMLRAAGLSLDVAPDGAQAVEMAHETHYDLVLMDLEMPKMDGYTAARTIRSLPGYAQTPILALTAHVFPKNRQACLEAKMDDFITKPVRPATLYTVILKWLDRHD